MTACRYPDRDPACLTGPEPGYGYPASLWRALDRWRPATPRFRSPLRGPWLTAVFGRVLLGKPPLVILTGLLDFAAYGPRFGQAFPHDVGWLRLPPFDWPTRPPWRGAVRPPTTRRPARRSSRSWAGGC